MVCPTENRINHSAAEEPMGIGKAVHLFSAVRAGNYMVEVVVDTITERQVGLDKVTKIVNVPLRQLASTRTLRRAKLWTLRSASDVKALRPDAQRRKD